MYLMLELLYCFRYSEKHIQGSMVFTSAGERKFKEERYGNKHLVCRAVTCVPYTVYVFYSTSMLLASFHPPVFSITLVPTGPIVSSATSPVPHNTLSVLINIYRCLFTNILSSSIQISFYCKLTLCLYCSIFCVCF